MITFVLLNNLRYKDDSFNVNFNIKYHDILISSLKLLRPLSHFEMKNRHVKSLVTYKEQCTQEKEIEYTTRALLKNLMGDYSI